MSSDEKPKTGRQLLKLPENMDDKDLAIVALMVIAIVCIITWQFDSAVTVVSNVVTAIAGVVTGRALKS